jgi:hypothetical protein
MSKYKAKKDEQGYKTFRSVFHSEAVDQTRHAYKSYNIST